MKKHVLALAIAAVLLAACGKKEEPVAAPAAPAPVAAAPAAPAGPVLDDEKVLNIYNWPDYITETMVADFEKEFGIKVNYDTFENNEALHAKLVAGNSGYDIVVPTAGFGKKQIDGGLYQPIDRSKLSNYGNLDPEFMAKIAGVDPENKHFVPWAWGFTTVGINKQKVEKALGDMPMPENAWDLVFKPEQFGQHSFPTIGSEPVHIQVLGHSSPFVWIKVGYQLSGKSVERTGFLTRSRSHSGHSFSIRPHRYGHDAHRLSQNHPHGGQVRPVGRWGPVKHYGRGRAVAVDGVVGVDVKRLSRVIWQWPAQRIGVKLFMV